MEISPPKEKPELSPAESEKFLLWESVIIVYKFGVYILLEAQTRVALYC